MRTKKAALLATSDSNIAVDNLVEGLAKAGVKVVRLGRPEMSKPELLKYCADEIAAKACGVPRLSDLRDAEKKRGRDEIHRAIEQAEVVCCTAMGAGSGMLTDYNFPRALMDEASQATEPASVVPVCKGCKQLVLVGDHCQLPPTVSSDLATKAGMCLSLFERLAIAGVQTAMLAVQYRMHPIISEFPRNHFYAGELADGISGQNRPAPEGFAWPDPLHPLALVPVTGWERKEGTSWENEAEAQAVVRVVQGLLRNRRLLEAELGVCTPYGAQARLVRRMLQRVGIRTGRDSGGIEVNSVDSFQGREKDCIVLSTVRSNTTGQIGFTADWRRANVAFTRAKRGLVVVCDPQTLSRDDRTWGPWLHWVHEKQLCCGPIGALPPLNPNAAAVGIRSLTAQRPMSPSRGARGRSPSPRGGIPQSTRVVTLQTVPEQTGPSNAFGNNMGGAVHTPPLGSNALGNNMGAATHTPSLGSNAFGDNMLGAAHTPSLGSLGRSSDAAPDAAPTKTLPSHSGYGYGESREKTSNLARGRDKSRSRDGPTTLRGQKSPGRGRGRSRSRSRRDNKKSSKRSPSPSPSQASNSSGSGDSGESDGSSGDAADFRFN